jgi:hypothetical protein
MIRLNLKRFSGKNDEVFEIGVNASHLHTLL